MLSPMIGFLMLYIGGCVGFHLFGMNDPTHFGSLAVSCFTLFRACTGEALAYFIYPNAYGCAEFPPMGNAYNATRDCTHSEGKSYTANIFFNLFYVFGGFLILSLFVSIVLEAPFYCTMCRSARSA